MEWHHVPIKSSLQSDDDCENSRQRSVSEVHWHTKERERGKKWHESIKLNVLVIMLCITFLNAHTRQHSHTHHIQKNAHNCKKNFLYAFELLIRRKCSKMTFSLVERKCYIVCFYLPFNSNF